MRKAGKITLIISLILILLNSVIWFLISFTRLRLKHEIPISIIYGIGILCIVISLGLIKNKGIKYFISATVITSITYFFILFVSAILFWDMCSETISEPIYSNRYNKKQKIVIKEFGCGVTDSTPNSRNCCVYDEVGLIFYKLTAIDTTNLDKSAWMRKMEK